VRLVQHLGMPVFSVAYRLAPDHRAPAPVEDGVAVVDHLVAEGADRLVLCRDSAGGAIALATQARLPDRLRRHIACVASFYGAHGLTDTASIQERGNRADGTDRECIARYFDLAGRESYSIDALARASEVPVDLTAAEDDALRDDSLILARVLEDRGRKVTIHRIASVHLVFLHGDEHQRLAENAMKRFAASQYLAGKI
jgi:monoterpene epsilon-lactone hydrolase